MRASNVRFLFATTSLLAAASGALAQSALLQHGEIIAASGDLVPGLTGGETFGGASAFDTGAMDDNGNVFFRGRIVGGTALNERALFYGSTRGNLSLVIRSGDPEPSGTIPGATLDTGTAAGIGAATRISANGTMFFSAQMFGGGVTTANDAAFFIGTPGNFQILAREGDPAPGTIGAKFGPNFTTINAQLTSLNNQGRVCFQSTLTGGDVVGSTNNVAWFTGTPGSLVIVHRKGDLGPGGESISTLGNTMQMNSSGQVLYNVEYVLGSGTNPVTAANNTAVWLYTPGSGSIQVIREGDPSPIPGVTYNQASNAWFVNTGATTFNASGDVILKVDLGGAVTTGTDDTAVLKVSASGHTVIARRGEPVLAIPGTILNVFNNNSLQLNGAGRVAFEATLFGAVTTSDDSAIFSGAPGNIVPVVREGSAVPGMPGFVWGDFNGQAMQQNNAGQILFANQMSDGATTQITLASWDPIIGIQVISTVNDVVEFSPGSFHPITSASVVQFGNGEGRPLTFRDNGDLAARVNFQDGTSAMMTAHVGSFVGTPSEMSAAAGGLHNMYLNGGVAQAGNTYLVLGSASGTSPGFPAGAFNCPLNPDLYFNLTILYANTAVFANTIGTLDASGKGSAVLSIPPGVTQLVGLTLNHAFLAFNPFGAVKFASSADGVKFVP